MPNRNEIGEGLAHRGRFAPSEAEKEFFMRANISSSILGVLCLSTATTLVFFDRAGGEASMQGSETSPTSDPCGPTSRPLPDEVSDRRLSEQSEVGTVPTVARVDTETPSVSEALWREFEEQRSSGELARCLSSLARLAALGDSASRERIIELFADDSFAPPNKAQMFSEFLRSFDDARIGRIAWEEFERAHAAGSDDAKYYLSLVASNGAHEALPRVLSVLQGDYGKLQLSAAREIAGLEDKASACEIGRIVRECATTGRESIAKRTLEAIAQWKTPAAKEEIHRLALSADLAASVRQFAMETIGTVATEGDLAAITAMIANAAPSDRAIALSAVAGLGSNESIDEAKLLTCSTSILESAILGTDEAVRNRALQIISNVPRFATSRVVALLRERESTCSTEVERARYARALSKLSDGREDRR